jgi:cytochrome c oxidase assembly factor CtaG
VNGINSSGNRSGDHPEFRNALAVCGAVLWILFLAPPLTNWSLDYGYVQAIQFCVFATAVPALLVAGAPWRHLRVASGDPHQFDSDGALVSPIHPLLIDRWALIRARRTGNNWAVAEVLAFILLTIFWRSAPMVDTLVRHPWLIIVEAITMLLAGVLLWLDLIESPPLKPRTARPYRIGMSAITMWTIWVVAYLQAMSHDSWYPVFRHVAGHGVSAAADQQLTAGSMWLLSAAALLPVVFWNLIHWLTSEEDPDEELYHLVRRERSRGFFGTND